MSDKIDLPDGEWAVLRDPKKVPERLRRPFVALQTRLALSDVTSVFKDVEDPEALSQDEMLDLMKPLMASEDFGILEQLDDLLMVTLVESWSFTTPDPADPAKSVGLPVTVEGSLDLPGDARDVLLAECKPLVGPLTGQVAAEDITDPKAISAEPSG